MNTYIRKAIRTDIPEIYKLYESLKGTPECVWNEYYPTHEDAERDTENGALYILRGENGVLMGVASACIDEEQNLLPVWKLPIINPCELTRVGIKACFQKQGYAKKLILFIENDIATNGFDGIRLLAYSKNESAIRLYEGLGYTLSGEASMYDIGIYKCYEKRFVTVKN